MENQKPTITQCIAGMRGQLRPLYGDREAEAIVRLVFLYLKGWNTVDLLMHGPDQASDFLQSEIEKIMQRLLRHEPVQYITGIARFHGLDFHVTPDVLIPRPETDMLVDIICDDYKDREDLNILDICTGSGCIAIALARSLPFAHVSAFDISPKAIEVAAGNAKKLHAKVDFFVQDVFNWNGKPDSLDIIVSNPPYIDESEKTSMDRNVTDFEPPQALFVPDSNPLIFYKAIAKIAASNLKNGGRLYLEINSRHADRFEALLAPLGFSDIEVLKDQFGNNRFVRCTR